MSSHNNNDDLMMFTMGKGEHFTLDVFHSFISIDLDPLNSFDEEDESQSPPPKSDLSTSDYHSFVAALDTSSLLVDSSPIDFLSDTERTKKKMFDITELLGSSSFDDQQEIGHWFEKLRPISASSPSLNVVDYLRAQVFKQDQDIQWQIEQNHLKYGNSELTFFMKERIIT